MITKQIKKRERRGRAEDDAAIEDPLRYSPEQLKPLRFPAVYRDSERFSAPESYY
jgi:hypothetical protein